MLSIFRSYKNLFLKAQLLRCSIAILCQDFSLALIYGNIMWVHFHCLLKPRYCWVFTALPCFTVSLCEYTDDPFYSFPLLSFHLASCDTLLALLMNIEVVAVKGLDSGIRWLGVKSWLYCSLPMWSQIIQNLSFIIIKWPYSSVPAGIWRLNQMCMAHRKCST